MMSKLTIDTSKYERLHGKKPRGVREWTFRFSDGSIWSDTAASHFHVAASMAILYADEFRKGTPSLMPYGEN
jgi:hypothetical protein